MYSSSLERPGTRWRVPAIGIVAALVLSLVSAVSAPLAHAEEGDRSISGVVALPAGLEAALLDGVQVTARAAGDGDPAADPAAVGTDGAYSIAGLEPGAYLVEFSAAGVAAGVLEGQVYGATAEQPEGAPVDVSAESRDGVNATLEAVVGAAEVPAEADASIEDPAAVEAGDEAADAEEQARLIAEKLAQLEREGSAQERLAGAAGDNDPSAAVQPGIVDGEEQFSGSAAFAAPLGAPETYTAAAGATRTISGKITMPKGYESWCAGGGMGIYVMNQGTGASKVVRSANNCTWTATVEAGQYKVLFDVYSNSDRITVRNYYPNTSDASAAKAIDLRKSNAANVNATIKLGVTLTGTVTGIPSADLSRTRVYAVNSQGQALDVYYLSSSGKYDFSRLPAGDLWFQAVTYGADYKLKSMQFLKTGGSTKHVPAAGKKSTRNLAGTSATASIVGKVYVTGGLPKDFERAANVYQVLDGVHFPLYYAWQNYEGPYLSVGLAPGAYKVEFTAKTGRDVAKGEWWNKQSTRAKANVITLTSGLKKAGVNGTLRTGSSGQVSPFKDVKSNHKFYNEIAWMFHSGTSTGTRKPDGRYYSPKQSVTREAMAAFMFRMNAPANYRAPVKSPFADVSTKHKFYKEIAWMYTSGLSTGIKKGGSRYYDPKAAVSREAMAAFMFRQYAPPSYKKLGYSPFNDIKTNHKFFKEISWMYSTGLSTGVRKGYQRNYQPKNAVTREAMAAFLFRNALNS